MIPNFRFALLMLTVKLVRSEIDEYVYESRQQCSNKTDVFSCAKYRTLRYLSTLGSQYGLTGNASSPVKLVKIKPHEEEGSQVFPTARQLPSDSEFTKFWKFAKRRVNYYLGTQGLVFGLPNGVEVLENEESSNEIGEGRGKKKKATQILLPLLILFKLFKVKVMVALSLASLVFIKKALMLGALILPSIIQKLKYCKPHVHYQPHHHIEDAHDDDFSGFGGYGGYGGYGKDYERMYNGYVRGGKQR